LTKLALENRPEEVLWRPEYTDVLRFNVVGEKELKNDELADMIADAYGIATAHGPGHRAKKNYIDFHSSRPGHDLRYALNGTKLAEYGWHAPVSLEEGIERTVRWTLRHSEWL